MLRDADNQEITFLGFQPISKSRFGSSNFKLLPLLSTTLMELAIMAVAARIGCT